jgi:hypothetical protein
VSLSDAAGTNLRPGLPSASRYPAYGQIRGSLRNQPVPEGGNLLPVAGRFRANDVIGVWDPEHRTERPHKSPRAEIPCRKRGPRQRNTLAMAMNSARQRA